MYLVIYFVSQSVVVSVIHPGLGEMAVVFSAVSIEGKEVEP
jgi:hypothetical protein